MLVLDGAAVRAHLSPKLARAAVEEAFRALRRPSTYQPLRTVLDPPLDGLTLLKPAAVAGSYGLKLASLFPGNRERGLDPIQGFVVLLDPQTGVLDAVLDAAAVTELRTAAASAVATDLLAPRDATRLGLLGAGPQARSHLLALREVRALERVTVCSPRTADDFVAWAEDQGIEVEKAPADEVVRTSDVVCTVTSSPTPVVFGRDLRPGTHVNAVGAFRPTDRELDTEAITKATVVVDMREAAAAEAGALLLAHKEPAAELTDVLSGAHPGRTSDDDITVFSSTGLAVQDVAAARAAVDAVRAAGAGTEVSFP